MRGPGLATLKRAGIALAAPLPLLPRLPGALARVPDGIPLTVVAINLQQDDRDRREQAAAVVALDADVLLLAEHTAATQRALADARLADRWPHLADDPDEEFFGTLVASKHPIVRAKVEDLGGRRGQVVDLDVEGTPLRVLPVHTQAPIHDHDLPTWKATVAASAAVASSTDGPAVLGGDWNASGGNRHYRRQVEHHGLVDAAAAVGHRWHPTWPAEVPLRRVPVPPVLVLDHVVVTPDVEVVDLERIHVPGSDHRGLRATLRLPRLRSSVVPG